MLSHAQRSPVSRGDLLRVLNAAKAVAVADCQPLGFLLGFERVEATVTITASAPETRLKLSFAEQARSAPRAPLQVPMLGAVKLAVPPADPGVAANAADPGPLAPLSNEYWGTAPGATQAAPAMPPIVPHGRLLPALDRALRVSRSAGFDIASWVDSLSRRLPPSPHARLTVQRLAPQRVLVLDMGIDGAMAAFRHDMACLVHAMKRSLGGAGFQVRCLVQGHTPLEGWLDITPGKPQNCQTLHPPAPVHDWLPLTPDTQVLLISDMGLAAAAAQPLPPAWGQWLHRVQSLGARVQVWSPVPLRAEQLEARHAALPVVHWSAAGTLRPQPLARGRAHHTPQRRQLAQAMLARLAFCGLIDAYLVRVMRLALGPAGLDAGLEQLVWKSIDLTRGAVTSRMRQERLGQHRSEFAGLSPQAQLLVQVLATDHYKRFSAPLAHMHTLGWVSRARQVPAQAQLQLAQAQQFFGRLAAAPAISGPPQAEVASFLQTWPQHADLQEQHHHGHLRSRLSVALLGLQAQPSRAVQIPAGMPHAALAESLAPGAVATPHWLLQNARSGQLVLSPRPPAAGQSPLLPDALMLATADIEAAPGASRQWLALDAQADTALALRPGQHAVVLRSSDLAVCIAPVQRPRGVAAWHRSRQGLHLRGAALGELALQAGPADIHLMPPPASQPGQGLRIEVLPQPQGLSGLSFGLHAEYGLFADLSVAAVVQRFIWIEATGPDEFLMGSSLAERALIDNARHRKWAESEGPQHRVHLRQSFWLADTPCTQALWLAVMAADNPSHFQAGTNWKERPVEQVSFDEVQTFLNALQAKLPAGCEAVLPTEAQWEYACRAGTRTAYWWGDAFDSRRANAGQQHKGTTSVKHFDANPWGLHDMHGNVDEWCADDLRAYADTTQLDPTGELGGDDRIVRGGTWRDHPASPRAAQREQRRRAYSDHVQGFRFALRSQGPGGAALGLAGGPAAAHQEGAQPRGLATEKKKQNPR